MPKRALQVGSAVSTSVASAMVQGVDWLTPTAASPQKRRATERQAHVCGPSTARKAGAGAAQHCPEGACSVPQLLPPRRPRRSAPGPWSKMSMPAREEVGHCHQ